MAQFSKDQVNQLIQTMLKSYLRIALRSLWRKKAYRAIAGLSLVTGLSAMALVLVYALYERRYDTMHREPDNTYRIIAQHYDETFPYISLHYRNLLPTIPGIRQTVSFVKPMPKFAGYKDKQFSETNVLLTDAGNNFFNIFSYHFLKGSPETVFNHPNTILLTASTAHKYFGNEDPVNKIIRYDTLNLQVTGIVEDVPANSHFVFDMLIYDARFDPAQIWGAYTYCLLPRHHDANVITAKLNKLAAAPQAYDQMHNFQLQPLKEIHLSSNLIRELKQNGQYKYLWIITAIGILILIVGCFNYASLSFILHMDRSREIAVRKVTGASRKSIALLFLSETVITTILCLPVVIGVIYMSLPYFNRFMDTDIPLGNIFSPVMLLFFLLLALIVGLLIGAYPAIALSRFNPIALLRNTNLLFKQGGLARKVVIIAQFTFIVGISIFSFFLHRQLQYLQQVDLGFHKEGTIKVKQAWHLGTYDNYLRLKAKLLANPGVLAVSYGMAPGDEDYGIPYQAMQQERSYNDGIAFRTDHDYFKTLGIQGITGNYFKEKEHPEISFLINEAAAKKLGYKDPLGKQVILKPGTLQKVMTINGVFRDFNIFSLHRAPSPMFITVLNTPRDVEQNILIKINTSHTRALLPLIEKAWKDIAPNVPISYAFIEDELQQFYVKERKLNVLSAGLNFITMILGLIGLVGLSAYVTVLRRKEIGVRKVLGASVINIATLLSADFLRLVLIAVVPAVPLAWYATSRWLDDFAYRVPLHWPVFAATVLITIAVTLMTISFHVIKAAIANPVKSLRTE